MTPSSCPATSAHWRHRGTGLLQDLRAGQAGRFGGEVNIHDPAAGSGLVLGADRVDCLKKACDIILSEQSDKIECAVVRNIAREGESSVFMNLGELREYKADMFCTVFIGKIFVARSFGCASVD